MKLAIHNLGCSRKPWRLVALDWPGVGTGPQEVCVAVHRGDQKVIADAVCGDTERECVDVALALLGKMIELRREELEAERSQPS